MKMIDYMVRGRQTRKKKGFRCQWFALTRNFEDDMARRTCFREQYYTGTRRYYAGKGDGEQYQAETSCKFEMVIWSYLWIHQFVWAGVFSGPRYGQSASMDCSGVIQKIHMRKIWRAQDLVRWWKWWISWLEAVRQGKMDVSEARGLRWRAMLQDFPPGPRRQGVFRGPSGTCNIARQF